MSKIKNKINTENKNTCYRNALRFLEIVIHDHIQCKAFLQTM